MAEAIGSFPPAGHAPRVLVVGSRFIGDAALAIPFLRNLRQAMPEARIDLAADRPAGDLLSGCPYVDAVIPWGRVRARSVVGKLAATVSRARALAQAGYDRVYLLKPAPSAVVACGLAGIPVRIGFASVLTRPLLSRAVRTVAGRHQVEAYLALLEADGIAIDDGRVEGVPIDPAAAARAASLLATLPTGRPRVFVAPCATDALRHWPAERWAELLHWLAAERRCELVFAGGPGDGPTHATLGMQVGPTVGRHMHDFSTDVTLPEAVALIARMDLCLGVDTGLVHVAAACGVPVVKLDGHPDPRRWHPRGARALVVRGSGGSLPEAMRSIDVESVRGALEALLPPPLVTLDLRGGDRRYDVLMRPAARADAATADQGPAAGPLESTSAAV